MADPVNPLGSLAASLPVALSTTAPPKPPPEKTPTTPSAELQSNLQQSQSSSLANPKAQALAVQQINANLQQVATDLKIQVDKETGRTVFKIMNEKTGKVVLQVPSEEVLAIARNLRAMEADLQSSGVLLDKEG